MTASRTDRLAHRVIHLFPFAFWHLTPMRVRHWLLQKAVRAVYS